MPTNTSSASAPSVSVRMTPDDANWVTSRALTRAADIPASWPQSAPAITNASHAVTTLSTTWRTRTAVSLSPVTANTAAMKSG
jgi:hypothetical protein